MSRPSMDRESQHFSAKKIVYKPQCFDIKLLAQMALEKRWTELNKRLGVSDSHCSRWWEIIKERYTEPQRHYHTLRHLEDMFSKFDTVEDKLQQPLAVSLAIFFHDIIYEPTRQTNEEQSAELFQQFAEECLTTQSKDLKDTLFDWILATKKHLTPEHLIIDAHGETDLHYFLDMDMAVLGREEKEYTEYVEQIEKEYSHMNQEAFNRGRTNVLRQFLDVPNIFVTREFRSGYELQARQNITNEITRRTSVQQN